MRIAKFKCQVLIFLSFFIFALFPLDGNAQTQFVTEKAYKSNVLKQLKLTSGTLAELRKKNVIETTELKLEYFFYTNAVKKAKELSDQLQIFGYGAGVKKTPDNQKLYLITGLSSKMKMSEKLLREWTKVMCDLGYEFDCEFKSWKTSPK